MANRFQPRSSAQRERKPDKNGIIKVTVTLSLDEGLHNFIAEQCEKEKRSISTLAVMQLEKFKETYERLLK